MAGRIFVGDCVRSMKRLRARSVQCCVTSPPYFGLRDYGIEGQIGLESSLTDYISKLVAIFDEVHRVLRDDGLLWVNLGDTYAKSPAKSLLGVPWRFAFAMQDRGWLLRQDIIWHKPNAMPESVKDRCSNAHEYVFLFAKQPRYYYDHIAGKEPAAVGARGSSFSKGKTAAHQDGRASEKPRQESSMWNRRSVWSIPTAPFREAHFATFPPALVDPMIRVSTSDYGACAMCGAPYTRRSIKGDPDLEHQKACGGDATGAYSGTAQKDYKAAKAQDPSATKARILAGMAPDITVGWDKACACECNDVIPCRVLDPFGGAGTTGLVANRLGRDYLLCELNPEYAALARERIKKD